MKILFALSSAEYLRYYDDTMRELAGRGHDVVVAAGTVRQGKFVRFDDFGGAQARITVAGLVPPRADRWTRLAAGIRGTMDFVRYLHPRLADARALRARMKRQALPASLRWLDAIHSLPPAMVVRLMNLLARLERAIPAGEALDRFLAEHRPDVVLVSPLVEAASEQADIVTAARGRGIPVGAAIASWDNLTNKGDLRAATDFVLVWNEAQKREAVELHRVPAERVIVTGAQLFDRWFDRVPRRSREDFCRMVGLPARKPFVMFVGSSIFIARAESEVPFVRRWIEAIRGSGDPAVRDLGILLRPHPYSGPAWAEADWSALGDVAVWPRARYNPVDEDNRADFFDSMHHAEAVAGINTSAMIEAAIVGRPVLSVLVDEFAASQEGTLHFRHLLPENGGFLRVSTSLDEHLAQLAAILSQPEDARRQLSRFVGSFIRPLGLERPCTPILADAIEAQARRPARAAADGAIVRLLRALLLPLAALANVAPADDERKAKRRKTPKAGAGVTIPMFVSMVLPFAVATLVVLGFAASELAGKTPFAYAAPRNIAEAAGMGLASEVLRYQHLGQDPRAELPVAAEIISADITRVTAVEAAIWSRRLPLVQLLDRSAAVSDPDTRWHLACVASDIRAREIEKVLRQPGMPACVPGAAVARIAARAMTAAR